MAQYLSESIRSGDGLPLNVSFESEWQRVGAEWIIQHIANEQSGALDLQSFPVSWPLELATTDRGYEVIDFRPDGSAADSAAKSTSITAQQLVECSRQAESPRIPSAFSTAAVSPGLYEQGRFEGVRYVSPEPMSGWVFTANGFSGAVEEYLHEHLWHLVEAFPEVARFLGLPAGYWFDTAAMSAQFDPELLIT
ncbi:MAG: hypothetical protein HKN26_12825 [Acidimicrobiales bacterium]|nr:hypothetical protein [Acidimicrobiales bacterium]